MTFFIIIWTNETRVYNNNITFVEMSEELGGGGGLICKVSWISELCIYCY